MLFPESRVHVVLHGQPVDIRKSFDGLIALTRRPWGRAGPAAPAGALTRSVSTMESVST